MILYLFPEKTPTPTPSRSARYFVPEFNGPTPSVPPIFTPNPVSRIVRFIAPFDDCEIIIVH